MIDVFIKAQSYYLPKKVLTNEELIKEFPKWTVEKVSKKVGINSRHIADKNETVGDMAYQASEKLFSENNIDKSEIDFILLCTQTPDYFLPTTACTLQSRLGLSTSCGALDFNLGCSGYVYGLSLAKGLINGNMAKNVLLITSEAYSKHMHSKDKKNRTIFGDAATATIVSTTGNLKIGNFSFGTDGRGSENLIVKTGAFKFHDMMDFDENEAIEKDHFPNNLYMNGAEVFKFSMDTVPKLVKDTLEKNALSKDDIDQFIFHQANKFMLDTLKTISKISNEKFIYSIDDVGNTVSSTIPIALNRAIKENKVNKKDKVLLAGFGVGYSWAGCVLECQ
ncbi:ketoacyl-ACP synthase III [Sulfurospirillum barnesii]|uniref:3-oxoacyl-(Acyl-carrier-protein) synthase III n=1 Tax=Sulfurospirillum barnesii (strain ATCC 700032 / DSM 10660 / SES-3) TaxID=760154 RepID=I3XYX1_SULBS|nr:ketoacyl-ACP synthase III [Sulfurospirillum barnesii]AFL69145.1 3-oxoacyl-(acyl-carrier-protein) synthase III [Sulfurospirillum barnesii SES-3]